jgi:DNA-binding XRE family transcriptional regulator
MESYAKLFGEPAAPSSAPVQANVFYISDRAAHMRDELPQDFVSIQDVVVRSERSPDRAERIKAARKRLASRLFDGEPTLKSLRLHCGLSQATLAAMIGTSQPHIARIESGSDALMIETCRRLCTAFEVDMNTLDRALTNSQIIYKNTGSK